MAEMNEQERCQFPVAHREIPVEWNTSGDATRWADPGRLPAGSRCPFCGGLI